MRILIVLLMLFMCPTANAALINQNPTIAVMDLGVHDVHSPDIDLLNIEKASSEYIISRLVESKYFDVMDKDLVKEELEKGNIKITGIIDPDTAKRIGEFLNAHYIVYGNIIEVFVDYKTVNSIMIVRIMEVETGRILMAARGKGKSGTSYIDMGLITIGTKEVPQICVHNSLKKAAFQATDILIERLFPKKN